MLFRNEYCVYTVSETERKEPLSPADSVRGLWLVRPKRYFGERAFFRTSPAGKRSRAALTVEAAIVLPVFLLCMIAVLQHINVYRCAARLGAALAQTGEEMAIGAYATEYGEKDSLLGVVLSSAYGAGRVNMLAGDTSAIKNDNFLLSSFLEKDDLVDLVMTYQVRNIAGMVQIPNSFWIQRGCVRGWTGREGSSGERKGDDEGHNHEKVYVTENGTVYHRDANCTHIKLNIIKVSKEEAEALRNVYREKYHPCEHCGRHAGDTVYITSDGNRYHSSLDCPGLKRTVREVGLDDVGELRPCSRCGG